MSDDRWRDAGAYAYQNDLPLAGVAWEFLRRNASYQTEFAATMASAASSVVAASAPSPDWGLSAFADPQLPADRQPVFWRPEVCPRTIILSAAPIAGAAALTFDPAAWPGQVERHDGSDGVHLLLRFSAEEHRLWAPGPLAVGQQLAVAQPLDRDLAICAEAASRFFRRLSKPDAPPIRPELRPLIRRASLMLRALDARAAGASQRLIAEVVLGVRCAGPRIWEESAARAMIARLLRCGSALKAGGYLDFLRRGRGR
jgi:hypothetical protein